MGVLHRPWKDLVPATANSRDLWNRPARPEPSSGLSRKGLHGMERERSLFATESDYVLGAVRGELVGTRTCISRWAESVVPHCPGRQRDQRICWMAHRRALPMGGRPARRVYWCTDMVGQVQWDLVSQAIDFIRNKQVHQFSS